MIATIVICAVTCLTMILAVLFFPKLKLGKLSLDSYWIVTLVGAIVLLLTGLAKWDFVLPQLTADTPVNPLKILVLFVSMTILSIYLDELGFFSYLANVTLKKAGASQTKLFLLLYFTVSLLTVFTSNDIIILSFTPFICYFAKNAKVNPMPYLAAEFVAANTWSMALVIGNPTNIYLTGAMGIGFVDYLTVMLLPTLTAGIIAFGALFLLYRKQLNQRIDGLPQEVKITDKLSLWVGIIHIVATTVTMAIGSYLDIEMWRVSLLAVVSLTLCNVVIAVIRQKAPDTLWKSYKRAPWQLIPFVLSMFVMIIALNECGITNNIANFLGDNAPIWKYGVASFLASNLINNIPMSVLFSSILENVTEVAKIPAAFATVIGSNLGACFTPIGALAGIMWSSILRKHNLKFGYLDFLKIGVTVAIPTLLATLFSLQLVL